MIVPQNIASQSVILDRKVTCKGCPSKNFYRELQLCLANGKDIKETTRVKTNQCPKAHW